jgi:hypothetical protein
MSDILFTDPPSIRYLLDREPFLGPVWEPCSGAGAIVRELQHYGNEVIASDLRESGVVGTPGINLFTIEKAWNLVTNPPYTDLDRVIAHLVSITTNKCALLLPQWVMSGIKRRPWWILNQPDRIYPLPWRPRFLHEDDTLQIQYWGFYWFVWDRNRVGNTIVVWD